MSIRPSGSKRVTRTLPVTTKPHSAALACQCNSRTAPESSHIETPARSCEMGISAAVTCLAEPAATILAGADSRAKRNSGSWLKSCFGAAAVEASVIVILSMIGGILGPAAQEVGDEGKGQRSQHD